MAETDLYTAAAAVRRHATPERTYRDVIRAVRQEHPDLSREAVLNAAFFMLATRDDTPEEALRRVG